jgi:two-component system, NtrC family, sensor kinase
MMSRLRKILLVFFLPVSVYAQDSVTLISPGDFVSPGDQVYLASMNGWLFRQGNNRAWADEHIETSGWQKLKPVELSAKYADKNGRVEGWFRIRIKMSSAVGDKPLGIKMSTWAATDLFINGKLISSFGNTGLDGGPFRELSPYGNLPVPVNLKAGELYTIALHFVDYLAPLYPRRLKSEDVDLSVLIRITGPGYPSYFLQKGVKQGNIYATIWIAVSTILCLLFWLLYFQNPLEKNLRLIAIFTSFSAIALFCQNTSQTISDMSYMVFLLFNYAAIFFVGLACITMPRILVNIFNRKITTGLGIVLSIIFAGFILSAFLPTGPSSLLISGLLGVLFGICIYYLVSSWKTLRGAQWSIVAGLLFSLAWALVYALWVFESSTNYSIFYLSITGYALSLPISLLVYVAIRFKEIIHEVRENAKKVVQLSEEKKEQAVNRQKMLQEEVDKQTAELRTTLADLKATQSQLIQSEKMASLGELTAGIAHEIQNPLNFINNFSEVNKELIEEMEQEIDKGRGEHLKTIAADIKKNEEKINHHGKRADAIVKGMLQHSRSSSGQKEPTDINALADEYLRLSFHGLRAKDKSFNATLKTDFDPAIGKMDIIPQDIGRVLLNLNNNAFYAVSEKAKKQIQGYEPTVSVVTKKRNDKVEIWIMDNGAGVSQKTADKIFQPFFTTKPAGQGTGLGLSMSYDIVKAHGGELKLESAEGEGAKFLVQLPVVTR